MEQQYPPYHIVLEEAQGSVEEKKSRFIATLRPVAGEDEALLFVEEMKKKYWDAKHHCSAYVLGGPPKTVRCSDDGEPGGTAGRPMLEVLSGQGLQDTAVVVARYFGGTLLGTGGLMRAYTQAVQAALANSRTAVMRYGTQLAVKTDYHGIGKIRYLLAQEGLLPESEEYGEAVRLQVTVPFERAEELIAKWTEATGARAQMTRLNSRYFIDKNNRF